LYRKIFPLPPPPIRVAAAERYLKGNGIEIGALNFPLPLPKSASVKYVDRKTVAELRARFPELDSKPLIEADVIDDGETLETILDNTQDFVIACHVIEHCQNPIGAIKNWLRVLKAGGTAFIAVPDKRYTFDVDRPLTPIEHVIQDYNNGPEWSREAHYVEWEQMWIEKCDGRNEAEVREMVANIRKGEDDVHFHVWTQFEFIELLLYCRSTLCFPFEIDLIQMNGIESVVILTKTSSSLTE
jgi:SAM-dependent methyltransferase